MTPRDILTKYLYLDKTVMLQFASALDVSSFRSGIHTAKSRLDEMMIRIGAEPALKNKTIYVECISKGTDWPKTYKVYAAQAKRESKFKLIAVEGESNSNE